MLPERNEVVAAVREFVDREVMPVARELEAADEYPATLVDAMRGLGLFGVTIPERWAAASASISRPTR